jgi:uncharacterized membrane-anchored protein YhcB (DUF1043 family)
MLSDLYKKNSLCDSQNINYFMIIAFLIGFLFFNIISKKNSLTQKKKEKRILKAKNYMDKYQEENEAFFMS